METELTKVLVGAIAVLALFLRGLLDYLKSRKPKVEPPTTLQVKAAVAEALSELRPITKDQADTLLRTTAKDMVEGLVRQIPCFAQRDDCAQKVKEHWQVKRHSDTGRS